MEKPKDRLRSAMERAGYASPSDAARAIRTLNKNTLISHTNGNRPISRQAAEKYAKAFGVSAGWILYGPSDGKAPTVPVFEKVDSMKMPVRGEVAAGQWLETAPLLEDYEVSEWVEGLAVTPELSGHTYCLRVKGTSINKIAPDGAFLVCLDMMSGVEIIDRDIVIVERIRDQGALREVTAKRVVRRAGQYFLKPESTDPKWQEEIALEDGIDQLEGEIRIVAKVKHIITSL